MRAKQAMDHAETIRVLETEIKKHGQNRGYMTYWPEYVTRVNTRCGRRVLDSDIGNVNSPLDVYCTYCGAPSGRHCVSASQLTTGFHSSRQATFNEARSVLPAPEGNPVSDELAVQIIREELFSLAHRASWCSEFERIVNLINKTVGWTALYPNGGQNVTLQIQFRIAPGGHVEATDWTNDAALAVARSLVGSDHEITLTSNPYITTQQSRV